MAIPVLDACMKCHKLVPRETTRLVLARSRSCSFYVRVCGACAGPRK